MIPAVAATAVAAVVLLTARGVGGVGGSAEQRDNGSPVVCPSGFVAEWQRGADGAAHALCRSTDGTLNWVCPRRWSRTKEGEPKPPFCSPPKTQSFAKACGGGGGQDGRPVVSVFIRTYHGDVAWLPYVLRSICAFGGEVVSSVVVAYPDVDAPVFDDFLLLSFPWVQTVTTNTTSIFRKAMLRPLDPARSKADAEAAQWRQETYGYTDTETVVRQVKMAHPGYAAQIYDKLCPDTHVPAGTEFVMNLDSDVVLHRALSWSDVFGDFNRPRLEREAWTSLPKGGEAMWRESTTAALKLDPDDPATDYDYMRRIGNTYPVGMYGRLRREIERLHGVGSALEWFVERAATRLGRPASEFEVLGIFAWLYEHEKFDWRTCDSAKPGGWQCTGYFPLVQGWSWGGLQADTTALFECILQQHATLDACRQAATQIHDAIARAQKSDL